MLVRTRPRWFIPEREVAPESAFQNRRELLLRLGAAGIAGALTPAAVSTATQRATKSGSSHAPGENLYPARRNERYAVEDPLTPERIASHHNVFDEFALERGEVWKSAARFKTSPWRIHVGGAVERQLQFDVDDLVRRMGIEERHYRFRCVETWAMAVPRRTRLVGLVVDRLPEPANSRRHLRPRVCGTAGIQAARRGLRVPGRSAPRTAGGRAAQPWSGGARRGEPRRLRDFASRGGRSLPRGPERRVAPPFGTGERWLHSRVRSRRFSDWSRRRGNGKGPRNGAMTSRAGEDRHSLSSNRLISPGFSLAGHPP